MKKLLGFLSVLFLLISQTHAADWYIPSAENVLGRWWQGETGSIYHRFPDRFQKSLTADVWGLSTNSAGLYIKFESCSRNITVRYTLTSKNLEMWHMPSTGVSGVDLYLVDSEGHERWCASSSRSFADTVTFKFSGLEYGTKAEFTLYLPLYNGVEYMEIGVDEGSSFAFLKEDNSGPVVVYGTSIAQGACASRPGLAWSNILHRRLRVPVINYGFSGNGLLHDAMFQAMAEIPACAYIIDCMPNMAEFKRHDSVVPRLMRGMKVLRSKGETPVILVEHDGYMDELTSPAKKKVVADVNVLLREAYDSLLNLGYKNLYYVTKEDIGMDCNSQVDGCHANDYGMLLYADVYQKVLDKLFCKGR